ncbi:MAG: hypothetical protein PHV37_01170 [Candidatus Gastranaerophilales bacterium]|nr:hypothetical protein [Candidatus Gastranaerophilales bacterium]
MIEKYIKYLAELEPHIKKSFDSQKAYIHCKAGCSICCETGHYPMSKLEFDYMKIGLAKLDKVKRDIIIQNISDVKHKLARPDTENPKGYYCCPFLINKQCAIYNYRGIICRTYGLLCFTDNGGYTAPCCVSDRLNYSEVYDIKRQTISKEMFKKSGIKTEPLSFNFSLKYLLDNELTKDIDFGESKKLIEWF